jgi:hypothetical protein
MVLGLFWSFGLPIVGADAIFDLARGLNADPGLE